MGSPGSINECKDVVNSVFSHLNGAQKYCKVLVDEVHVKPAVRYQGKHIVGFASDQEKPARSVLALMVCPLLGAPAFVARLIPIYTINSDLLFEQINIRIKIIHESSGSVFLLMNDNRSANIKCYDQLHRSSGSLNEFSIPHPVKTDTFNCLFLLYDHVHLFKNIKSNWITEKMKRLKLHYFQTMEDVIAEWKDKDIVALSLRERS